MLEELEGEQESRLEFEILAMDERSRDNTLAVLSLLSGRIDQLQAFQDIPRGTAIMQGLTFGERQGLVDLGPRRRPCARALGHLGGHARSPGGDRTRRAARLGR